MKGRIVKSTGLWYEVDAGGNRLTARLRGKFRLEDKKITNPVAVGDLVTIKPGNPSDREWVIVGIEERTNYVIRKSPRKKGHFHLLAANIDQGVLIATLKMPKTSTGFIDRFLITLEAYRIPGVVLFNKEDLYEEKERKQYEKLKGIYESIGYEVALASFHKEVSHVRSIFQNKISLLCGHSGAGKSTLINKIIPQAAREVKAISSFSDKGVHTTTFAELFEWNRHSSIIDTPGIKEWGLAEMEPEELPHYFPEMRAYLGSCKFHNCLHQNEPGCRVKATIGKNISEERYINYRGMLHENDGHR